MWKCVMILATFATFGMGQEDGSCGESGHLGSSCQADPDCNGETTVCRERGDQGSIRQRICVCHEDYFLDPDTGSCQRVPDKPNTPCPDRQCKKPMRCIQGLCKCPSGGCKDLDVGDRCEFHSDCTAPYSHCNRKVCDCMAGTQKLGRACIASKQCPDGSRPGRNCEVRHGNNVDFLRNVANSGSVHDNCPAGHYCVTDGSSITGHCCEQVCPLGQKPSKYDCSDSRIANSCPLLTHYCHSMVGPSFSVSLCCLKPCRDPTSIFVKGRCYAASAMGEDCEVNEQCDSGLTMECRAGACFCKNGYKINTQGLSAKLTCVKDCGAAAASIDDECFRRSKLGGTCSLDQQCGTNGVCHSGRCVCACGFDAKGGKCQQDEASKGVSIGTGSGGGIKDVLANVLNIFKGKTG